MALTAARNIALFQILEVPYATSKHILSDDALNTVLVDASGAESAAKDAIISHVATEIETDANLLAVLTTLLDAWTTLGLETAEVVGGALGELQGVNYSPERKRDEIRRQVLTLVPFFRAHESVERRQDRNIRVLR